MIGQKYEVCREPNLQIKKKSNSSEFTRGTNKTLLATLNVKDTNTPSPPKILHSYLVLIKLLQTMHDNC